MSYGTVKEDAYRQTGNYVGRILKGERPGIAWCSPPGSQFVINLKSAKTLSLNFHQHFCSRRRGDRINLLHCII